MVVKDVVVVVLVVVVEVNIVAPLFPPFNCMQSVPS